MRMSDIAVPGPRQSDGSRPGFVLFLVRGALRALVWRVPVRSGVVRRGSGEVDWEKNRRDVTRRARREVVDYAVANALRRLVTLTVAGDELSPQELRGLMGPFLRRLRRRVRARGNSFAYVYSVEPGEEGRWHVHLLLTGVAVRELRQLWTAGSVDVVHVDSSAAAGNYLIKPDIERPRGMNSYSFAPEFKPERERYEVWTLEEGVQLAETEMGSAERTAWFFRGRVVGWWLNWTHRRRSVRLPRLRRRLAVEPGDPVVTRQLRKRKKALLASKARSKEKRRSKLWRRVTRRRP